MFKVRKQPNLKGKRFGKLKVISFNKRAKYQKARGTYIYWNCKCDCGKNKVLCSIVLINKTGTRSCGCSLWKGFGEISGGYFSQIKHGAIKRNMCFDISLKEIWDLFLRQNRRCALTGLKLKFVHTFVGNKNKQNASLDRIDSSKGYIVDNVQWIYKWYNRPKNNYSNEEFINWCVLVSNNKLNTNFKINFDYNENNTNINKVSKTFFGALKRSAKRRKIKLEVSEKDIWNQYLIQGGICYYSGVKIHFVTSKNRSLGSVSVDRVNSKKPYSKDNIVLVHKKINTLKWDLTENEFFKMCKRVSKYNKGKYESYN